MDFVKPLKDKKVWMFAGLTSALTLGIAWILNKVSIPVWKIGASFAGYDIALQSVAEIPKNVNVPVTEFMKSNGVWPALGEKLLNFFNLGWDLPTAVTAFIVGTLFVALGYVLLNGFGVLPSKPFAKVWAVLLVGYVAGAAILGMISGLGSLALIVSYVIIAAILAVVVVGLNKYTKYPEIP